MRSVSTQYRVARLRALRSWLTTQTLIVFLWRSMPTKFMVDSLCGNRRLETTLHVYHDLKATGTGLRPPSIVSKSTLAKFGATLANGKPPGGIESHRN